MLRAYVGRWVAVRHGQVVGVGLTANDAALAAQLNRPRERPTVLFMAPFLPELPPLIDAVRQAVPDPSRVWLVGGVVRDALLGRRLTDFDFAVAGDGRTAARAVANALNAAYFTLDEARGVGRVLLTVDDRPVTLDFASLRGPDLPADLHARDFTLNALAVPLAEPEVLIDVVGGEADLRAKIIRLCAPTACQDDPLRAVRAVRLATHLQFKLSPETRQAAREAAPRLAQVSPERQRDELMRVLGGPRPATALRLLEVLGLLKAVLPELAVMRGVTQSPPHTLDVWEHTLAVVQRLEEVMYLLGPTHDVDAASELILGLVSVKLGRYRHALTASLRQPLAGERTVRHLLMLAALFHDVGKPATRTMGADGRIHFYGHEAHSAQVMEQRALAWHLSSHEVALARTLVGLHMRARQVAKQPPVSRRAIYRFFREAGEAGVGLVLFSLADHLGKFGGHPPPQHDWAAHLTGCAELLAAHYDTPTTHLAPPPLLDGHAVMTALNLPPGPRIGAALEALREAQAAGEVSDREQALAWLQAWAQAGKDTPA